MVANVAGEAVIGCVTDGHYYALDSVGTDVWGRLATPRKISDLCDELRRSYRAQENKIEADVLAMLGTLVQAGALHVEA